MGENVLTPKDVLEYFMIFLVPLYAYFYTLLKEEKQTKQLIARLEKFQLLPFYRSRLQSLLDRLDNYLTPLSWSWKFVRVNLSFHYTLAIIYLFVVFFLVWFLGGSGDIGALPILPTEESLLKRTYILISLIAIAFIFRIKSFKSFKKLDERFKTKFQSLLPQRLKPYALWIEKALVMIIIFIFFYANMSSLSATLIIGSFFVVKVDSVAYLLIYILVAGLGIALLITGLGETQARTGIVLGVVLLVGLFGLAVSGVIIGVLGLIAEGFFYSSIFIFFIIIPFLNALLDFLSFTISRYFFSKIAKGDSVLWIILHIMIDFALAFVFLGALYLMLYGSIEFFNSLVDTELQIPINIMLKNTLNNPFGLDNLWITFMLLSTLLPTFVHLLLALVSVLLYVTNSAKWYANLIKNSKESESQKMKASAFMAIPTGVLAMALFYLIIYLPYVWLVS